MMKTIVCACLLSIVLNAALGETAPPASEQKIGILLVNHGSRSATWRKTLLGLEANVRPALSNNTGIRGIKTAFMEYTEPSIATQLKAFDADAFTDVILVPLFLTVSAHTFDDIPTVIGKKVDPHSLEMMRLERIERYKPKARTYITPNLDFAGVLKENVLRRARSLSTEPAEEGLVMIAYGDSTYEKQWAKLLDEVGMYVRANTGIERHSYGWCGHVVHYDPNKTTEAVARVLERKKRSLVIPVLVAHDEMFQIKIIGDGLAKIPEKTSRVVYRPDSILPDPGVEKWVVDIALEFVAKVQNRREWVSNP